MITFVVPAEELDRVSALPSPIGHFLIQHAKLVGYGQFVEPLEIPPGTLVFSGLCHFFSPQLALARQIERQMENKPGLKLVNRPSHRLPRRVKSPAATSYPTVVRISGPGYFQEECVETEEQFHHLIAEWILANYEVERISVHGWLTGELPIRTYSAFRIGEQMKNVSVALTRTYPLDPASRIHLPEAIREDQVLRQTDPPPGLAQAFDDAGIEFGVLAYLLEGEAVKPWLLSDDLSTVLAAVYGAGELSVLAELANPETGSMPSKYQPDLASARKMLLNLSLA